MKYFLLPLLLLLGTLAVAQNVNIPDSTFKNVLLTLKCADTNNDYALDNDVDSNDDGEIQLSEALAVTRLYVPSLQIKDMTGIKSFSNLKYLFCSLNKLTALDVSGLVYLRELYCEANTLTSLNVQGLVSLQDLWCSLNQLTTLNVTGLSQLLNFGCANNQIAALDVKTLSSLKWLECHRNQLNELNVQGLLNLYQLSCNNNQISSLNVQGLPKMKWLNCDFNPISTLDLQGLSLMEQLSCKGDGLQELHIQGLSNLGALICSTNQLTELDLSGLSKLTRLECTNNQLPSLGVQGSPNLEIVRCDSNALTTLDLQVQSKLKELRCAYNQLGSLFIKNGKVESTLFFDNNPDLAYICCDEQQVPAVQAKAAAGNLPNCIVNAYCSFVPGGAFFTLQGRQTYDLNTDGCDSLDQPYAHLKWLITDGSTTGIFISDSTGYYNIPVQAGTHTIRPVFENPSFFTVQPDSLVIQLPADSSQFVHDFCIAPNGVRHDLEITLLPLNAPRPGFEVAYQLVVKNKGTNPEAGSVYVEIDSTRMQFVSADPTPDVQGSGHAGWNFSNLAPNTEHRIQVVCRVNSPMDSVAVFPGAWLLVRAAAVLSAALDEFPQDNAFTLSQTVVGSYDPNDITCLEGASILPDAVGGYLHYLIRFENTGTYPAEHVVIQDIIDTSRLDPLSLELLDASHNCYVRTVRGNEVEFVFENILLPFSGPGKSGFVAYKIKTRPTLVLGDTIPNQADIYFDYNFPVRTNQAETVISMATLAKEPVAAAFALSAYPNPAGSVLYFNTREPLLEVDVTDVAGRLVLRRALDGLRLDVSGLQPGHYFAKVTGRNGVVVVPFVKGF
ncbi:MAG: T9SS type A sorting domain-containing protein [Saprospiraceae bacterium]|nr:T9SS type A sorting domain-containing protein [Saprospiraceae bacterium]